MAIIGNPLNSVAFLTDSFNGNGSTTAFTMSVAPATSSSILVVITGVTQAPSTYSVVGTTLTFSTAPPSGTANISVRYLGIPASGVTTTAYRTLTEFTATASQTTFTPPSYTVGFIAVYQNGVMLGSTDYTATNGTTVVLAVGALVGDLISTESFYVSSVLNALPVTGGTISGNLVVTGTETVGTIISPAALTLQTNNGTTAITVDTSQNVGIGTSTLLNPGSPDARTLTVSATKYPQIFSIATTAAANNTTYRTIVRDTGVYQIQMVNDAGTTEQTAYEISRSANSVTYQRWYGGTLEAMRIDSSGNLLFNSGYGSAATAYGCRAWVKFAGATGTISASGNVSSVTRDATGLYRVNFTTAMVDANYSASITMSGNSDTANTFSTNGNTNTYTPTTTYCPMSVKFNGSPYDASYVWVSIFR